MSESLEDYYRTNGLMFGGVDILCLGRTATQTIAKTLLGIFSGAREPTGGRSPIHSIAIVYPSASLPSEASAALSAAVVRWAEKNADLVPEGRDPSTWIELVPVDFQASSVTGIAKNLGPNGLLIVLRAADFRGGAGETETTAAIQEDVWVPQLFALARDLLEVARTRKLQVVLEAGQDAPSRREHQELLQSLDGVGILGAAARPSEEYLARNLARWDELLHQGRIGVVLQEVDAAPELSEQEKQVCRIQLLHRAGLLGQALEALEQLQQIEKMPALLLARLSRIASTGGADFLATRLLAIALPGLQSIDELIMGLAAADELDDDKLGDEIAARLEAAFPRHPAVTSRRRLQLRREGRFSELAENLRSHSQDENSAVYYSAIATALAPVAPAYELARADLDKQFPDRRGDVSLLLARHAMSRQRVGTAVRLLVPLAADQRVHASLLLDAMEMLILGREVEDDAEQLLRTALISAITYLSNNPKGASFRVRLTNLLSFELAGHSGVALLASVVHELMSRPLDLVGTDVPSSTRKGAGGNLEMGQLRPALTWLNELGPVLLGQVSLPNELVSGNPDDIAAGILDVVGYTAFRMQDEGDVSTITMLLGLAAALNAHTEGQLYDLSTARLAVGGLILAGKVQLARDIAEQVLRMSSTTPRRRRAGWSVFGDIYLRLGSTVEGLIGFACAAAGDTSVDADEVWLEASGLARLMRNLGLYDHAREMHDAAGRVLTRMGLWEANAHRTRLMSLSIDFMAAKAQSVPTRETVAELVDRATRCVREALEGHDGMDPAILILAQTIALARRSGTIVPGSSLAAFYQGLEMTSGRTVSLARALASERVEPHELLALHRATELARYADDAGFDAHGVAIGAELMLAGDGPMDASLATFLVELLSDRAIAPPGWDVTSRPVAAIGSVAEPGEVAARLSAQETVLLLAFDAKGRLTKTTWTAGAGVFAREPVEQFSADAFAAWRREFPYHYGVDDGTTPNLFYVSTEELRLSDLPEGPIVVVADSELQAMPVNLLRVGDSFAGQTRAMSAVPSLSWLSAARETPAISNGKRKAWISQRDELGQTLVMIADRLSETFTDHGIVFDGGDAVPEGLGGSDMVVVAAHGSLGTGAQFQRVSDEGNLVLSAADLSAGLRNVRVVVLFVCSGGRSDKVPGAIATSGLARRLLHQGCSAVIASPWPLDARVTYHWLPAFLSAWHDDCRLDEAVLTANRAVERAIGPAFENTLAMALFGDPALKQMTP